MSLTYRKLSAQMQDVQGNTATKDELIRIDRKPAIQDRCHWQFLLDI